MRLNDEAQRALLGAGLRRAGGHPGCGAHRAQALHRRGGNFTELGRLSAGVHAGFQGFEVKQINYSELEPGAIKAFHIHRGQTDVWFVPPADKMLLVLLDVRAGSPTEKVARRFVLGDGASRLVRIPPGVAHGVKNLAATRGRIIYLVDVQFQAAGRDRRGTAAVGFAGAGVWDVVRG